MAVTHAPPMQGPRVALALNEREFDAAVASLGLNSRDPNSPSWGALGDSWGMMWPVYVVGDGPAWLVGLGPDLPIAQIPSVLVHEAVHVWQGFREHIGEDRPSKEFEAYSIESIFTELMRQFGESREGRKRIKQG